MKRLTFTLVLALAVSPGALAAQAGPTPPPAPGGDTTLGIAMRLATEGRRDSARALVRAKLRATPPRDSLYPAVLFTAGVIAGELDSARTYFRRVSIEYANSPWADDALLRLAQLAFAAADYQSAGRTAERVLLDYPLSDRRAEAAYWAARAQLELGNLPQACTHLATAQQAVQTDVELTHQVTYYAQRCRDRATDSVRTDAAAARTDTAPGQPVAFAVQVAAVSNVASADEVMRALNAQGFQSRVFRDTDGLWKVRVGRFARRTDAERLAAQLAAKIGGRPFVVEER